MTCEPAVVHPLVDAPIPPIGSPDLSDRKYEQYGRPTTPLVGRFLFCRLFDPDENTLAFAPKSGQATLADRPAGFRHRKAGLDLLC
jgi:hypothetical protein